jgi:hypothetical protein
MKEKTTDKSKLVEKLTSLIQKTENTLFSFFGPLNYERVQTRLKYSKSILTCIQCQ